MICKNVQNMICKNIKSIQNEVLVIGFNGRNKCCGFHFFDYVNKNMKLCKYSFNFSDNLISFCFFSIKIHNIQILFTFQTIFFV